MSPAEVASLTFCAQGGVRGRNAGRQKGRLSFEKNQDNEFSEGRDQGVSVGAAEDVGRDEEGRSTARQAPTGM